MISRIKGVLVEQLPPAITVDVQGVGYEIQVPMTTLYEMPPLGNEVILHTHFVVREDAQMLFGFRNKTDRSLFQTLIKVNGVGPKMALAIMSTMSFDQFALAVENEEVKFLTSIPGVGKKTAERMIVEMRGKLEVRSTEGALDSMAEKSAPLTSRQMVNDAEQALTALGYKPSEISKLMAAIDDPTGMSVEQIIKAALAGVK